MPSLFAQALADRTLVLDGAMGTSIYNYDLDTERDYEGCENCTDILARTRPDVILEIHESFLAAGCDCVETDTFGSNKLVLAEFDLQDETFSLNEAAARIAREACDKFAAPDKPRFVLGSMGPGTKLITLANTDWPTMLDSYAEQARGLIAGGVDALLIETCQDIQQVKCAVNACLIALEEANKSTDDIPICVSVTIEQQGTMLLGTTIEAAAATLRTMPILSLGLNCATGPTEMSEYIQYLAHHWDRHVTVYPNAGLPALVDGKTEYPLQPEPFTEAVRKFIEHHSVSMVGGCCGTTPEHIRTLAQAVAKCDRPQRTVTLPAPSCASLYNPTDYRQDTSFLIIGERCNASGSRKFKQLLEAEDWDGIVSLARQQLRDGSHVLDINVDYAGRDNAADMQEVVSRLVRQVDAPLMLDSTQPANIEAGLQRASGKAIINSANFEDGDDKFDAICALASTFAAGIVIGTIDEDPEQAMARTADRKLEIASRAIERATTVHNIPISDIFIDPLVLPISTGMDTDRRSALELIEGTKRIAERFPEVQLTCGLSNVSFGLKPAARVVLNAVLLHELVNAGMTSAIVHASKIIPLNKVPEEQLAAAHDLISDKRAESAGGTGLPEGVTDESHDPLAHFIGLFTDADATTTEEKTDDQTIEDRLRTHIIDGEKDCLTDTLEEALTKYAPLSIINDHLLEGMKTVGVLFGSGQMQLPFVLQSAEVMKQAVAHLEPLMQRAEGETKGSIVLATVKGDVHDIGKNLVDIILTNNGYTVHNIGIKQTIANILDAWRETKADAIGLSGLLVKSVNVMEENLAELNTQSIEVPVILGGAALARHYCEGHLRSVYEGELYYGKDAFDGLRTMDLLTTGKAAELNTEIEERLNKRSAAEKTIARSKAKQADKAEAFEQSKQSATAVVEAPTRSLVARDTPIPAAPFLGSRVIKDISLSDIFPFINTTALFRGQWQFRRGSTTTEQYQQLLEETVYPTFERIKQRCITEQLLQPAVVYAYYPVQSDGNDLLVFDPEDASREIERFTFPRQQGKKSLCIADFFRSTDSGEKDILALSCVTMGQKISEIAQQLFEANDYTEYLYMHGIGVECAEALAECWHKRMRAELGIGADDSPKIPELFRQSYRGSRYSPGYPACPDMSDQDIIWRLLDPTRIGCTLTENHQIDPEQSTSAFIIHHPEAKYFNV